MIRWLLLRIIEDRIFYSQRHKSVFTRRCAVSKTEGHVRHISRLKQAILSKDKEELQRRQKFLAADGILPPHTIKQCDKLIEDLRKWREM
jgi:hypothetical protein